MYKSVFLLLMSALIYSNYSCDKLEDHSQPSNNQMVVYPNIGNVLYLVDYQTFEVTKTIKLNIPDSIGSFGMCLSTNKDFLIFPAMDLNPPFKNYMVSYHIKQDSIYNIFPTGLDSIGAPRTTAAQIPDEPGLIYFYSHNNGLYSIDFLTEEVKTIYTVNGFGPGLDFHNSPDKQWIAVNKYIAGGMNPGHNKIEFYGTSSGLYNPQFILNENNQDSIQVGDLAFLEDNKEILIAIRIASMREIADYFGSYDLETKELYKSSLTFPWSISSYFLGYSPKRKEAYLVGEQDKFYIVDTSKKDYKLKAVLDLPEKVPGPSRILITPDEDIAFLSCSRSNFVLVIDLNNRRIIQKIEMERPYLLLLLE